MAEFTALAQLRGHAQNYRLRRRQVLPASAPDSVYIIRSGLVAAEHAALPSRRTMVELLYPGDLLVPGLQAPIAFAAAAGAWALAHHNVGNRAFAP